jgi:hypothetical protein
MRAAWEGGMVLVRETVSLGLGWRQERANPSACRAARRALLQVPIIVRRYLPDGSYEDWAASELIQ